MKNLLDQLRACSGIVADSSQVSTFEQYAPLSGITTNPTLLLKGMQSNAFPDLISESVQRAADTHHANNTKKNMLELAQDWLLVLVADTLKHYVDGRVSIEVDARLAYNEKATFQRAIQIIELAESIGITPDKLLIKLASTWEGIQVARQLEMHGIGCNMTLLFDFYQALACAQAQATLISPFVGRITDWYKQQRNVDTIQPEDDPGIEAVKRIYHYFQSNRINTLVMAASFRSTEQICHLAGCNLLTISPNLLDELAQNDMTLFTSIHDYQPSESEPDFTTLIHEETFRTQLANNTMASEKLTDGIHLFSQDQVLLEKKLREMIDIP